MQPSEWRGRNRGLRPHAQRRAPATILRLVVCASMVMLAPALGAQQRLNDSGQVACFDDSVHTGTVSAPTPDPETTGFDLQDCTGGSAAADAVGALVKRGGSSVAGRDYSKISNAGGELPASVQLGFEQGDWNCTRDNVTGLVWELKWRLDYGLFHRNDLYAWFDDDPAVNGGDSGSMGDSATCTVLASCNTMAYRDAVNALAGEQRLCGRTDWRLPTLAELESLLEFESTGGAAIDGEWFFGTPAAAYRSTDNVPSDGAGASAWALDFGNRLLGAFGKDSALRVRLVRSDP